MSTIHLRDLEPTLWPSLERLFGNNGACGGCWCMAWRIAKGETWGEIKGEEARRRMKVLVETNCAHGVLAFSGKEPIGWCTYGHRTDFSRLDRAPSLACPDAKEVSSLPCFFVKRGYRGSGVATQLLAHALATLKERGANIVEGYPVKPDRTGKRTPDAFAWTGTRSLFLSAGFSIVGNENGGKQRVRKRL